MRHLVHVAGGVDIYPEEVLDKMDDSEIEEYLAEHSASICGSSEGLVARRIEHGEFDLRKLFRELGPLGQTLVAKATEETWGPA